MKFICFFFGALFISGALAIAQKIEVTEASETVDNVVRSGLYTVIALDIKQVEKAWERHLKTFGKTSSSKGFFLVPSASIPQICSKPASLYSRVQSLPEGTKVWWAIDLGDGYATNSTNHSAYTAAQNELHVFAVDCYRYDINEQIKDAEKAHSASVRNYEKEVRHGEQLQRDIAHNSEEKTRLEAQLRQNAAELEQLKKDVEQNKTAQKDGLANTEKMKQAIEVVKGKLDKVQ